ncbi:MAG TPA: alpha/beta fold hydrolase [bacterium]|nr:alpha/beta fold hydrolase [bacterium]HXK92732.1 alpha/beta fold hydrolase [bacterium]
MNLVFSESGKSKILSLILVHAFPLNGGMWKHQVNDLSDILHVYAPDLPGFGRSKPFEDAPSMADYAKTLIQFMDEQELEKAIFGGCSMGGYILFELWRQVPERIAGLILCDTRAEADTPEAQEKRLHTIEDIRNQGTDNLAASTIPNLLSFNTLESREDVVAEVIELIHDNSPIGIIHALQALAARPDSTSTLAGINVPTLILVGSEDILTPPSLARSMQSAIPNAQLEILPDAGHLSPFENPQAANQAIRKFLKKSKLK